MLDVYLTERVGFVHLRGCAAPADLIASVSQPSADEGVCLHAWSTSVLEVALRKGVTRARLQEFFESDGQPFTSKLNTDIDDPRSPLNG